MTPVLSSAPGLLGVLVQAASTDDPRQSLWEPLQSFRKGRWYVVSLHTPLHLAMLTLPSLWARYSRQLAESAGDNGHRYFAALDNTTAAVGGVFRCTKQGREYLPDLYDIAMAAPDDEQAHLEFRVLAAHVAALLSSRGDGSDNADRATSPESSGAS